MAPNKARSKCHEAASADSVQQLLLKHINLASLQELQGEDADLFTGELQTVADQHGKLLKELLQLGPFVTKALLASALVGYTSTLGIAVHGDEWYRAQA